MSICPISAISVILPASLPEWVGRAMQTPQGRLRSGFLSFRNASPGTCAWFGGSRYFKRPFPRQLPGWTSGLSTYARTHPRPPCRRGKTRWEE